MVSGRSRTQTRFVRTEMGIPQGPVAVWTQTKSIWWVGTLAGVLASACGGGPTSPSSSSVSVGHWTGTTTQGASITLTVSPDETLTTIAVGYSFNGCSGTQTFSNLNVRTAPNVTCISGPCSDAIAASRSFFYLSPRATGGPTTILSGLFFPGNRAEGQVSFVNYPGCGTATGVDWTATRR